MNLITEIDNKILFFFNNTLRSDVLDLLFVFLSDRKNVWVLIPVLALTIYIMYKKESKPDYKKLIFVILTAGIAVGLSDLISSRVIKPLFERPRPCQVLEGLYFWRSKAQEWVITDGIRSFKSSFSFVSSHVSNSMAAATVLCIYHKKYCAVFILTSLLIGLSRMYLGVHYPSDVLFGWIVGCLTALGMLRLFKFVSFKYENLKYFRIFFS
ncbi:MAG: phosphatase PAP2 family protein [Candidatus Delongbacteria bacterium]|nr:phosphatase PAP2 family protein [Candidatus Delongbacteria bacterium]